MAQTKKSLGNSKGIDLKLPATSANLGPAFDAAGLAFEIHLKVHATPALEFSATARGRDSAICGQVENHLILTTYCDVLRDQAKLITPLTLRIANEIPIGKGCGSSAAARLAGVALAVHFGKLNWTDEQIISEASRRERHPDNAAACWLGGLAIARMSSASEAQVLKIQPKGRWSLLVAVAEDALSTEEARRVLPAQYSREDAVTNVQNSMMLLAAFVQGRSDLLASALEDRIHQPYRARLCPLLPALQRVVGRWGVLGVALSGAGPSVLVFLAPDADHQKIKKEVASYLNNCGLSAELLLTSVAEAGARDHPGWRKIHRRSR